MSKDAESVNAVNMISSGTQVRGDIESNSGIRIDGVLKGKMNIKGKVVTGASGLVEGDIFCQTLEVSGTIRGNIQASEMVSLKSSSKIYGEIITRKLAIEPGALFTGTCKMESDTDGKEKAAPGK